MHVASRVNINVYVDNEHMCL